jgi:hypothetical protein
MENQGAPTSAAYSLSSATGLQLQIQLNGSVAGFSSAGVPVLAVYPAWATDAHRQAVSTHYSVSGGVLTQVVQPSAGTAYPMAADPQIIWYAWGYATKFTKAETKKIAGASTNAGALAILYGLIASAPGVVLCGVAGFLVSRIAISWLNGVVSRRHCLQLNVAWFIPAIPYEVTC